jgi:hypothetical protein
VGQAGRPLLAFWQARHERFTQAERRALFAHLFDLPGDVRLAAGGVPRLAAFDEHLGHLAATLITDARAGSAVLGPAAAVIADELAGDLAPRMRGLATAIAPALLTAVHDAIELFKAPEVQRALHAQGPWSAMTEVIRRWLGESPALGDRVIRGRGGLEILAWLASAPRAGSALSPGLVAACESWSEATLRLFDPRGSALPA